MAATGRLLPPVTLNQVSLDDIASAPMTIPDFVPSPQPVFMNI
jgi:hypothetical protein